MGPQNYTLGNVIDPGLAFSQGLQSGEQQMLARQQQAVQLQQQQAALLAQQRREQALQEVISNPRAGAAGYSQLMLLMPKESEAIKRSWETLNSEQSASRLSDLTQWTAAIEAGKPEFAVSSMLSQADALDAEAGKQTPEGRALRALAEIVKADPTTAARVFLKPPLFAHPDGGKVLDNIAKQGTEQRAVAAAPAELRKKEADATTAETTAKFSERQALADTTAKEVTAEYAKPLATAELKQRAAQLGLTGAQTNQAIATTKKFNAETQKLALEAVNGDPNKKFDFEKALRGEFTTQAKEAILTQDTYKRMTASRKDAVGDIALIFGYMKMLDPTSVVREGEFATAQSAAGVPDRILNLYNKAVEGKTVLPEGQRQKILAQARDLALKADEKVANVRKGLMPAVSAYKLDENNIFSVGTSVQPAPQPPAPKPAASEPTATNPKTGERLVLRGGKWVPL